MVGGIIISMKYLIFMLLVVLLIVSGFDFKYDPDYSVNITVYTHGTHKLWSYSVNNEAIKVIKYSTSDEKPKTIIDRKLTKKEQADLNGFMKKFPLNKLKKKYENKTIEGEIHYIFDITKDAYKKEIYVYFYTEKNLKKLSQEIDKLIPKDYQMWYGKE